MEETQFTAPQSAPAAPTPQQPSTAQQSAAAETVAQPAQSAQPDAPSAPPAAPAAGQKQPRVIDLGLIIRKISKYKWRIAITMLIAAVVTSVIVVCVPRYYTTATRVSPEMESAGGIGAISSLASQFGFDLGEAGETTDAISPLLYPDLMDDNAFVAKMFDIKVTSADGQISTTYYDYLLHYQLAAWWEEYVEKFKQMLPQPKVTEIKSAGKDEFNPYILDRQQFKAMKLIRSNVEIGFDKKTSVISISVTDQDRLICKTIADSVRSRLMAFITDYRTSKARNDVEYYQRLATDAQQKYETARRQYSAFSDANTDVELPSLRGKLEDMENDMQLKYNTFTAISTQLQAARAKLQERTPVFTVLQGAEVPLKPAGPKRMLIVAAVCFLTFFICVMVSLKDEILR